MTKHPFSQAMLEATKQAIRTTGVTKTQIATATGNGSPWVTKLLVTERDGKRYFGLK